MTFEEKMTWGYLASAVVIPAWYFTTVLGQVGDTPVTEIPYISPMLVAVGAAIVAAIVVAIVVSAANPSEAGEKDQRDKDIERRGEYVGGVVLSVAVVGVLILTMLEYEHFWLANAIYAAFILQAITSSLTKIVAYRRGF